MAVFDLRHAEREMIKSVPGPVGRAGHMRRSIDLQCTVDCVDVVTWDHGGRVRIFNAPECPYYKAPKMVRRQHDERQSRAYVPVPRRTCGCPRFRPDGATRMIEHDDECLRPGWLQTLKKLVFFR